MIIKDKPYPRSTLATSRNASERALWNLSLVLRKIAWGKYQFEEKAAPLSSSYCEAKDRSDLGGSEGKVTKSTRRRWQRSRHDRVSSLPLA